jgi:hypothetical protein
MAVFYPLRYPVPYASGWLGAVMVVVAKRVLMMLVSNKRCISMMVVGAAWILQRRAAYYGRNMGVLGMK